MYIQVEVKTFGNWKESERIRDKIVDELNRLYREETFEVTSVFLGKYPKGGEKV